MISAYQASSQARVNAALEPLFVAPSPEMTRLYAAMRYSVMNGGKRVRPLLGFNLRDQLLLFLCNRQRSPLLCKGASAIALKDFLQFVELEPQLLGALDKHQPLDTLLCIYPVLPQTLRRGQQPDRLIVTNRLDGRARQLRGFADVHENSLFPLKRWLVSAIFPVVLA